MLRALQPYLPSHAALLGVGVPVGSAVVAKAQAVMTARYRSAGRLHLLAVTGDRIQGWCSGQYLDQRQRMALVALRFSPILALLMALA